MKTTTAFCVATSELDHITMEREGIYRKYAPLESLAVFRRDQHLQIHSTSLLSVPAVWCWGWMDPPGSIRAGFYYYGQYVIN